MSNNLGFVKCLRGVYNAAWVHCKKARKMRRALLEQSRNPDEQVEIQKRIGLSYSTLGDISRFTGQYEQALDWLNQAVETFEATGDRAKLALVYTKLGATLSTSAQDEKDYLLAEAVLKKALSLGANKEEAHTLHVLGCVYRDQGNLRLSRAQ